MTNTDKQRIFAILNWKNERKENVEKEIIEKLPINKEKDKLLVFCREKDHAEQKTVFTNDFVETVFMSEEDGKNRAAGLNFVVKYLKENFSGKGAVAYTIYDSIQFQKDPKDFFEALETMMSKLKLDVWFNTYTDPCNFVFNKFDGRVSIVINDEKYKRIYDKSIIFTSHSNPNVMALDIDALKINSEGKMFDDRFEISMFWIIKFLCERARDKKGFMNHYPTISEEIGVYKTGDFPGIPTPPQQMQAEDKMFAELNLDHTPNQNIDNLMEFIVSRLDA